MNLGIIFLIFALQVVLALIVIVVLKKLLDRELVESALEQFEVLKYQGDLSQLKSISVVGHRMPGDEVQLRFKRIADRRFKGVSIEFSTEADLKGGIKVVADTAVIDCTLTNRLEKLFGAPKNL